MRFGRAEHDPVALAEAPSHRFGASPAPPVVDRSGVDYEVEMYANDTLSDCTCVSLANLARGVAALNGFDISITTPQVEALFGAVGGTTDLPAIPGLVAMDVIAHQAAHGFPIGNDTLVGVAGTLPVTRFAISNAIARLGGAYLGIRLYERDMDTMGSLWTLDGGDPGAMVGRHMINAWAYDTSIVRVGTWGALQPCTWGWLLSRLDEAHGVVWRQLARADGLFYSGVGADGLIAELS